MMNGRLLPAARMREFKDVPESIARVKNGEDGHEQNWIDGCKGGPRPCAEFSYAARLTEVVLLGCVALRAGTRIEWDAENGKVTNAPKANEFVYRSYREGWTL